MRKINEIAHEIGQKWKPMYFGAVPYHMAMTSLKDSTDTYCMDSAKSIILYFLANAQTWRGEEAKRIKKELKQLIGVK